MNAIQVSSYPSVGVKLLDRDHGHLEEILGEIQLKAAGGHFSRQIEVKLRKLAKRMQLHFALEESMMSATYYPGINFHRLKHQWLMDQMAVLATQDGRYALERNVHLVNLLGVSHHRHLEEDDLDYALWLNASCGNAVDAAASVEPIEP
jgi:hemerythrin-like metal-binding protein